MPTEEEVLEALRQVEDPELGMDIVELGLLYDVEVEGPAVKVTYTLTSMGCPAGQMIEEDIDRCVRELPGVDDVKPELTFEPPWSPGFDLAGFACSGAGSLDISDVRLPHPSAYYNQASVPRVQLLRDDLLAAGFDDPAKKYLVYYDQAQTTAGSDCGAAYVNAQS